MDFKPQHQRLLRLIGVNIIKDVEHFRHVVDRVDYFDASGNLYTHENRPANTAVVVLGTGACYVGKAVCSEADVYSRRIGHTISVGRALRRILNERPDFYVDPVLSGVNLRDACRAATGIYAELHNVQEA